MRTKSFIWLLIGIVFVGGAVGAAFFVGEALGKRNERIALTQQMQSRVSQFGAGNGGAGFRQQGGAAGPIVSAGQNGTGPQQFARVPGGQAGIFGGGAFGTVQAVNGNTILVTTQNGSTVSVMVGANTTIEKRLQGTAADIKTGSNISVGGQRSADGVIQAVTILMQ